MKGCRGGGKSRWRDAAGKRHYGGGMPGSGWMPCSGGMLSGSTLKRRDAALEGWLGGGTADAAAEEWLGGPDSTAEDSTAELYLSTTLWPLSFN